MSRLASLSLLVLVVLHPAFLYGQEKSSSIRPMRALYIQDQRDRGVVLSGDKKNVRSHNIQPKPPSLSLEMLEKRDAARRHATLSLLKAGKITTAQDFHDAAFIFQHGQTANDYLLAHIFAVEAMAKGDASANWIAAATLDRFLQAIGHPQVFGTQYLDRNYSFYLQHQNNPKAVAEHESEPGMTQQPYDDSLVPDPLRRDFCVPGIAQQKKNLKIFESGGYPSAILPPGCTR